MEIIGYVWASLIGVLMGLLGGGGSVLTIPVFVYLFGLTEGYAAAYSLFVIGSTSTVGAISNVIKKNVDFSCALLVGIPSITSVFLTTSFLVPNIPHEIFSINEFTLLRSKAMMIIFSALLIIAAVLILKKKKTPVKQYSIKKTSKPFLIFLGLMIGLLAGLVGVGGGFLIIPILVLVANVPMKKAVGTTLLIIALNSTLGFIGHLLNKTMDWAFLIPFSLMSIIGIIIGMYLSKFVSGTKLKKGFAFFLIIMVIYVMYAEFFNS